MYSTCPTKWCRQELVRATVLAALPSIRLAVEEAGTNSYNCYKLFGFDVLLDTELKPWLLGPSQALRY